MRLDELTSEMVHRLVDKIEVQNGIDILLNRNNSFPIYIKNGKTSVVLNKEADYMNISTTAPSGGGFTTGQTGTIDKQIQMLMKRKAVLFRKMSDIINGEDEPKVKEEKTKAIRMEINVVDLQIQQLIQKKMELEKRGKSEAIIGADKLPPSPSDLIHPDREPREDHFINIKV